MKHWPHNNPTSGDELQDDFLGDFLRLVNAFLNRFKIPEGKKNNHVRCGSMAASTFVHPGCGLMAS